MARRMCFDLRGRGNSVTWSATIARNGRGARLIVLLKIFVCWLRRLLSYRLHVIRVGRKIWRKRMLRCLRLSRV